MSGVHLLSGQPEAEGGGRGSSRASRSFLSAGSAGPVRWLLDEVSLMNLSEFLAALQLNCLLTAAVMCWQCYIVLLFLLPPGSVH